MTKERQMRTVIRVYEQKLVALGWTTWQRLSLEPREADDADACRMASGLVAAVAVACMLKVENAITSFSIKLMLTSYIAAILPCKQTDVQVSNRVSALLSESIQLDLQVHVRKSNQLLHPVHVTAHVVVCSAALLEHIACQTPPYTSDD